MRSVLQVVRLASMFVVFAFLTGLSSVYAQAQTMSLFNTGVDNAGNLLPGGVIDPHYTLISSPDSEYPGPTTYVASAVPQSPSVWLGPGTASKWIAPRPDPALGDCNAAGTYTYRTTFSLNGIDPSTVSLSGVWSSDNAGIDILINGHSTGNSIPSGLIPNCSFCLFYPFTISHGFVSGLNTLDFVLYNVPDPSYCVAGSDRNPTGLRVEFSCKVSVDRLLQTEAFWNPPEYQTNYILVDGLSPTYPFRPYDFSQTDTIASKGCALPSLMMGLQFKKLQQIAWRIPLLTPDEGPMKMVALDPGSLNLYMQVTDSDFKGKNVWFPPTTRDASGGSLRFHGVRSSSTAVIDQGLCSGFPVIVGVNLAPDGHPQHFVVVTGKQGNDYSIADPFGRFTSLSKYGQFETRGWVDPPADAGELDVATGNAVDLLVTNSIGQSTGFDAATGQRLEQIPQSAHFIDALEDDETGALPDDTNHSVQISQPIQGPYNITVTGLQLGTYDLSLRAFSQDGSAQPALTIPGVAAVGSTSSLRIQFSSTPGTTSTVVTVATSQSTVADVNNAQQLGLIDNAGIANALSAKINAASDAAARGDSTTASNVLNAFKNQVSAQTGKHITGIAPQVLQEDANSLISQLP